MEKFWIVLCTFCGNNLGMAKAETGVLAVSKIRSNLSSHVDHNFSAIETRTPSHDLEKLGWVIFPHILQPPRHRDK